MRIIAAAFSFSTSHKNDMNDKTINQPTTSEQKALDDVLENSVDYVKLRGKEIGIKWLHRGTIRKLTHVLHSLF